MTDWERLGQRLRLARERASFTQDEAARVLDVTPPALSQYESGKRRLDALALDRLAALYGLPVAFLLGDDQPAPDWEVAVRGRAHELSVAGKRGISELIEKVRQFEQLYDTTGTPTPGCPHPPFEALPARGFRDQEIGDWAEKSRRHFDVGIAPLVNLRDFLAAQSYQIFSISLGTSEDALSGLVVRHPDLGPILAINEDQAYARRPFSLAHGLAHGLFHYNVPVILCRARSRDAFESFADRFALHFLVPAEALHDRLRDLSIERVEEPTQIIHLARYFGISYGAMRWRVQLERLLTQTSNTRWDITPLAETRRLGYSVSDYESGKRPLSIEDRFPRDYIDIALTAMRDDRLSLRRVAELFDISDLELEFLLTPEEQPLDDLEEAYA